MMNTLTRNDFLEFKKTYSVFSTVLETDSYLNENRVKSDEKMKVNTMFHPLTSKVDVMEYGENVDKMLYCVLYDLPKDSIEYYDIITIDNEDYEVISIKYFNTHMRVDVKKKVFES